MCSIHRLDVELYALFRSVWLIDGCGFAKVPFELGLENIFSFHTSMLCQKFESYSFVIPGATLSWVLHHPPLNTRNAQMFHSNLSCLGLRV